VDALELPIRRWDVAFRIDAEGPVSPKVPLPGQYVKITIEQFSDTYVAYVANIDGIVIGQGDTYETALADVQSAIRFHLETFDLF
jgi:predicted RNase H-like HicB family nuclease